MIVNFDFGILLYKLSLEDSQKSVVCTVLLLPVNRIEYTEIIDLITIIKVYHPTVWDFITIKSMTETICNDVAQEYTCIWI